MGAVFTACWWTRDPDRFDITRGSGGPVGAPFAPSWDILRPALDAMREADGLRRAKESELGPDRYQRTMLTADDIERRAWAIYVPAYTTEMRASYKVDRDAWDALAARERVVLVCKCARRERCHRGLLVPMLVAAYGVTDGGEI